MRAIITGGSGTIGRRLSPLLLEAGYEVIVLSRRPGNYVFADGVRAVQWDGRSASGWGDLADGAGAIINLAGQNIEGSGLLPSRWTAEHKRAIYESRLLAGQAVMEAVEAAQAKPQVLFQVSGADYYGSTEKTVDESTPAGSSFLARVAEEAWEAPTVAAESMGVRRVIGRVGPALTMEGGPLPYFVLQYRLFAGGRLGSGEQWLSWIHIDDVVRAIAHLITSESSKGVYNVAAPDPVNNKTFGKTLGKIMGRPSLIPAPAFALKLVLGEVSELVLQGQRLDSTRLLASGFEFQYPQLAPALRDLLNE